MDRVEDWRQNGEYIGTTYLYTYFKGIDSEPEPFWQSQGAHSVPEYNLLYHSRRMDIFAETVTRELDGKTIIRQNIVYLGFNKNGKKVTSSGGYQRTTTITESGRTVDYSKVYISPGLGTFVKTIEDFGRSKTVWDKYWEFILSPPDTKEWYENDKAKEGNRLIINTGKRR